MQVGGNRPQIHLISRGLKRVGGIAGLPKADLYFDARSLPDGAGAEGYQRDGKQKAAFVLNQAPAAVEGFTNIITEALKHIHHRRRNEPDPLARPFQVCVFCAYGINRSVGLKHCLAVYLRNEGYQVTVEDSDESLILEVE